MAALKRAVILLNLGLICVPIFISIYIFLYLSKLPNFFKQVSFFLRVRFYLEFSLLENGPNYTFSQKGGNLA